MSTTSKRRRSILVAGGMVPFFIAACGGSAVSTQTTGPQGAQNGGADGDPSLPDWRTMRDHCIAWASHFRTKDAEFLAGLRYRAIVTPKQRTWLEDLYRRCPPPGATAGASP